MAPPKPYSCGSERKDSQEDGSVAQFGRAPDFYAKTSFHVLRENHKAIRVSRVQIPSGPFIILKICLSRI